MALTMERRLPQRAFLDVTFAAISSEEALRWIIEAAGDATFRYVVTPNVDHVVMLHGEGGQGWRRDYRAAAEAADIVVNASRVLTRLARLAGVDLPTVPGSDLTRMLVMDAIPAGSKIAFVGGSLA